ncbi:MAG: ExeA family protein [Pseudomonadales bacterium]
MYESFYGLERPPFSHIPDPDYLYLSPQHRRALSILQYALMTRAGFCVITGNVGAGKTTLVRSLLKSVHHDVEIGLVSNTQVESFSELMRWILLAFDLDYRGKDKVEMYDDFVRYLIERFQANRPVTLIIDEAQHLGLENLEQLRMLSNVNTEKGQILQTILVGQAELWDLLRRRELQQFTQRISYDYFLGPLESGELTKAYIEHRLECAGAAAPIFDDDTFEMIWRGTGGVPRLINLVCDTALVYGYGEERATIGRDIIEQVLSDKRDSLTPMGDEEQSPTADLSATGSGPRPIKAARGSTIERAVSSNRKST